MDFKNLVKTHQNTIVLSAGYLLVATLAFGIGRITALEKNAPDIKIEEVFEAPINNTSNPGQVQSASVDNLQDAECQGKIKGNISSDSKIYHMPGGSFYDRTNPEMCFDTEQEAQAAGFRKSSR